MKKEKVIIALGGNLGDTEQTFKLAISELKFRGFLLKKVSSVYTTPPVNCVPGTGDFKNCVISGYWERKPEQLLSACQEIEIKAGRGPIHSSRMSRELDLDIILFKNRVINRSELRVPHPRASERFFVLLPLCDIEPEIVFPDEGKTSKKLLAELISADRDLFESISATKKGFFI